MNDFYSPQQIAAIVSIIVSVVCLIYLHSTNASIDQLRKSYETDHLPVIDPLKVTTQPPVVPPVVNPPYNLKVPVTPLLGNEGTSGRLFLGEKVITFTESPLYGHLDELALQKLSEKSNLNLPHQLTCSHWAVVTTINPPTDAVKKQVTVLPDWCVVVVGDKKGPHSYDIPTSDGKNAANYIFLSAAMQDELRTTYPIIPSLPWNHFGRKNIGYLYAIHHHAKVIYDFDDDNLLLNATHFDHHFRVRVEAATTATYRCELPSNYTEMVINPYPLLGAKQHPIWPRGYPLNHIHATYAVSSLQPPQQQQPHVHAHANNANNRNMNILAMEPREIPMDSIGVIQMLANHDPDVDAIYRMTLPIPYNFPIDGILPLLIPKEDIIQHQQQQHNKKLHKVPYTPYNAQATLHFYAAFWTLYLPISVHGRVSDIWRSYIMQRLSQDYPSSSLRLLFAPPSVIQDRNVHEYLADFNSEIPLYSQSTRLVEQLQDLPLCSTTLPGRMEELYIFLYEHGYLQIEDVYMIQKWIESLIAMGYVFPPLSGKLSLC